MKIYAKDCGLVKSRDPFLDASTIKISAFCVETTKAVDFKWKRFLLKKDSLILKSIGRVFFRDYEDHRSELIVTNKVKFWSACVDTRITEAITL
jgi:hypothetical protein